MENKVLLILCDGMRPDASETVNHPFYAKMKEQGSFSLNVQTVFPSVTLPCHMSLFHGVTPDRHGVTTNTYTPQVRPIDGLCEQLRKYGKKCAVYFDWEQLKDLTRPASLYHSFFLSGSDMGYDQADLLCTQSCIDFLKKQSPDFTFLYLGVPDDMGHTYGWMTDEYLESVRVCWDRIQSVCDTLGDEYTVLVTADHGGHGRTHGHDIPEDMTIPLLISREGIDLEGANIIDIAPSVCKLLDVPAEKLWEGKSFI